MIAPDFR